MACATLKRRRVWDPLQSSGGLTLKRRRCTPVATSPPKVFKSYVESPSPFGEVASKLTSEQTALNIREEIKKLKRRGQLRFNDGDSSGSIGPDLMACREPLFTFRQVNSICERTMKDREDEIRGEYDRILTTKLAEQYDTFLKFTYDQIQKRYENCVPSYIS